MQTTLTIPNKKADKYGKILPSEVRDDEPLTDDEDDFYEDVEEFYSEEFYEGLKDAVNELNEILAGRKQGRPVEELIAELRSSDTD